MLLLALAACGRRDFDALGDGGRGDAPLPADIGPCTHTFCADFTQPNAAEWDSLDLTNGGMGVTGSGTLTATIPATGDGAFVNKTFHATTSISIGFTLAYSTTGSNADTELDLVQLVWATPLAGCTEQGYFLVKDGSGPIDLQETYLSCGANFDITYATLEGTGAHTFVLTITLGSPARERLVFDGTTLTDNIPTQHDAPASDIHVRVGAAGVRNLDGTWTFVYSNLFVDAN